MAERPAPEAPLISHGCQYGCGNSYHMILISVLDGSTLFLCMPHFISTARDITEAMVEGLSPEVEAERQAMNEELADDLGYTGTRRGRHNAPVGEDDPDAIAAFDGVIYEDELDERFQPSAE